MHRIDGPGATVDHKFTEGDPLGGVQATVVTASWLTEIQEELLSILVEAGIAPVKGTQDQVLKAIRKLQEGKITSFAATATLTASDLGLVQADAAAAAVTLTLPDSNAALGVRDVIVRRVDNTGNRLVVQAPGTNKIKFHTHLRPAGYSFFVLMGAGDYWHLRSDGVGNWVLLNRLDSSPLGRPTPETTTAISPGGWGLYHGLIYNRADWPWVWDHAQASGMLTTEALRAGKEGCWTSGDGALTFRSPEGRAEFNRFLDEGRGVDVGRVAGSWQKGSLQAFDPSTAVAATTGLWHSGADVNVAAIHGLDPWSSTDYPVTQAVVVAGSSFETAGNGLGVMRARNTANPGRIKLI